jgi:hypothetical protein
VWPARPCACSSSQRSLSSSTPLLVAPLSSTTSFVLFLLILTFSASVHAPDATFLGTPSQDIPVRDCAPTHCLFLSCNSRNPRRSCNSGSSRRCCSESHSSRCRHRSRRSRCSPLADPYRNRATLHATAAASAAARVAVAIPGAPLTPPPPPPSSGSFP